MIFDKVKKIIVEKLSVDSNEVTLDASFEDLGADSLDIVKIVFHVDFLNLFILVIKNPNIRSDTTLIHFVSGTV